VELEGILFEKLPALHPPSSLHIVVRTYQFRQKRHKDGWRTVKTSERLLHACSLLTTRSAATLAKTGIGPAEIISRAIVSIHSLRMSRSLFRIRSYPWFHN
jgi:hypothetical protein